MSRSVTDTSWRALNRRSIEWRFVFAIALAFAASSPLLADEPSGVRRIVDRLMGRKRPESPTSARMKLVQTPAVLGSDVEPVRTPSVELPQRIVPAAASDLPAGSAGSDRHFGRWDTTGEEIDRFERMAIELNPTLLQARAGVDAAMGRQVQAGLYPNPTVGYSSSEVGNEGRAGQQGIAISQEIVRGGKLGLSTAVASFDREQSEAEVAVQFWRTRNSIRSIYFEALAAQETSRLLDELLSIAERAADIARQRERAGEGTLADVLQTQIELEQVRLQAANAANSRRSAWKRLVATAGQPALPPEPLHGTLEFHPDELNEAEELARIVAESPEVAVAEAAILRAEAAVARARVQPIPNVTLEAATQYDFATGDVIASLGLGLPIPIHDRNQGNIMAAESELRRANHERDRVRLSLADRYASAYAQYRTALEFVARFGSRLPEENVQQILAAKGEDRQRALDEYPQIVPRAQLALALATEGWQRGEFNYLQVLTAQRSLTQVRLGSVRAMADLRQSVIALDGFLLTNRLNSPD